MIEKVDRCPQVFITEIEISRRLLSGIFERSLECIIPRKQEVNEMNYFPIQDCDTGDNLALTLKTIVRGIKRSDHCPKRELIELLQEEILLDSARGNAGMIFTGWFSGFLDYLAEEMVLNTSSLGLAMERGEKRGYEVFTRPRKGTILDTISVSTQVALSNNHNQRNLVSVFEIIVEQARKALEHTTEELSELLKDNKTSQEIAELQENKVVDAGALGFYLFLTGFKAALEEMTAERGGAVVVIEGDENLEKSIIQGALMGFGDSLDIRISPSGRRAAVHIHTDHPLSILKAASKFGNITEFRIEDLSEDGA
ncbi:DAK2 domain-containing protein [candidate division WOR-3 bacterium]|uniref:DAK2 domain-containing protein n=1 Tax=candidate division WOR-3 bacterium TaxID=2052148 RepID=A0A9D5QC74_UNCW3|nr:DAK2 domain-containing protein [candidate division WOR-3 bacterium]MBD3364229.1 DAK2 domain-containing protein [candidate division WOR-3 bacterium]